MATLDYAPTIDGAAYDPQPEGGAVTTLRLFATPDRADDPVVEVGPATIVSAGVYQFTIPDSLIGRFWPQVEWTSTDASVPFVDDTPTLDLPYDPTQVCSPEDVAVRLGITLPLQPEQRERINEAIADAQADVEAYLNRTSLAARTATLTNLTPAYGVLDLYDWRAWPTTRDYDDDITVLTVTPSDGDDGTYTVTVAIGLDGRTTAPVARYVRTHAAETLRNEASFTDARRMITSLSTEGQSISYDKNPIGDGAAGALPNIKTLSRYRRLSAYRANRPASTVWPYRSLHLRG